MVKITAWWGVAFVVIIILVCSCIVVGMINNQKKEINTLNEGIDSLVNNKGFSKYATDVSDATVLILLKKDTISIEDKVTGGIFVASDGSVFGKATGFSVGDGYIITASHVVEGMENSNILIVWNGTQYNTSVQKYYNEPNIDFAIIKTNLELPKVNMIGEEKAPIGTKVGFVGYPLNEITPILHDGIVSSVREENGGFFWYTINSFVNRGNSGGPVFLGDTGKVIGIVSQRENEGIQVPQVDMSKLTEGERAIYQVQLFMAGQLASNSQVGIGKIVGLNQDVVNNAKAYLK